MQSEPADAEVLLVSPKFNNKTEPLRNLGRRKSEVPLLLFAAFIQSILIGCGASSSTRHYGELEVASVVSPKEQAIEEIQNTPKEFVVDHSEALITEQRLNIFLSQYLPNESHGIPANSADVVSRKAAFGGPMVHVARSSNFLYTITQSFTQDGLRYQVKCASVAAGKGKIEADLNARNLARFIKDGMLEVSVLAK